jgi:predicted nuclease of predicted toxin-antitoxin system
MPAPILAAGGLASRPGGAMGTGQGRQAARRVTVPRFLIGEKLPRKLVEPVRARGVEAMHVSHLGLRTETDWDLPRIVMETDWMLVTNNALEFRGRCREIELHPGIVLLLRPHDGRNRSSCSTLHAIRSSRARTW